MTDRIDSVTARVLWDRLISIADEAAVTLVRTAFSPVVQESNDYTCIILDAEGQSIADNVQSIPAFIGTMPRTLQHMLGEYPRDEWAPGDVLLTNDPWMGTGHLPDFSMAAPVFRNGQLVAFVGAIAHAIDVGGLSWASHAKSVFEEGIRIPISKFMEGGVVNAQLAKVIRANVRVPDLMIGDLMAQVAALDVLRRRLLELMDDVGLSDLTEVSNTILSYGELSMRRAISEIPDDRYHHALEIDGHEETLRIECSVTVAGENLTVDYMGTSAQVPYGINSVMNYTYAYTCYSLKCALDPSTPKTDGSYRPIRVVAPEGCILNPRFPAPVSGRQLTGMYSAAAVYGALVKAIPQRVIADSSGPPARLIFTGADASGQAFSLTLFAWGGMGARATLDGMPCMAFPGNVACASAETTETVAPILLRRKRLVQDSGGIGLRQGGAGQEFEIEYRAPSAGALTVMSSRHRIPAAGLLGGHPGSLTRFLINGIPRPENARYTVQPGDIVTLIYPGGGGYGPPELRDPAYVARDVADGLISAEKATRGYGPAWKLQSSELALHSS